MSGVKRGAMSHGVVRPSKPACAVALMVLSQAIPMSRGATPPQHACQQVTIGGEVSAGQEWKAALGQGWVFRIVPIAASQAGYSGWDLVVDREPPAGYPDALLVATLPYDSINEREIGTTFGLRAQDAIGWNPRSFRFLSDPQQFRDGRRWFQQMMQAAQGTHNNPDTSSAGADPMVRLLELAKAASSGELRIVDARIVPGIADPQPYAQGWALASSRTQHEIQAAPPGRVSAQGALVWMRFALTLWLPTRWRLSAGVHAVRQPCPQ
jgi:hypothetical protein